MPIKTEVLVKIIKITEKRLEDVETPQEEDWKEVYEAFHKYADRSSQPVLGANAETMCRKSYELHNKVFRNHISALDTN